MPSQLSPPPPSPSPSPSAPPAAPPPDLQFIVDPANPDNDVDRHIQIYADVPFVISFDNSSGHVIEEFSRFWMSIIGTRGATGKKTVNASTQFSNLFEEA